MFLADGVLNLNTKKAIMFYIRKKDFRKIVLDCKMRPLLNVLKFQVGRACFQRGVASTEIGGKRRRKNEE